MTSKRAVRRHHRERLKKTRQCYWGDYGEYARPQTGRVLGKKLSAPKPTSSCLCCMNQRLPYGPTRQELEAELAMREEVGDATWHWMT